MKSSHKLISALLSISLLLALCLAFLHLAPPSYAWPGDLTADWVSDEIEDTRAIAWGDVDGDGDPDLIVGNWNQPNRLYRNDDGTLLLTQSLTETANTSSLAWADVDGDFDLDLAVGNRGQVSRIYQNVAGTLVLSQTFTETTNTTSLAWADVDSDGDPDLAVGNYGSANRLYRNDGGALVLTAPFTETTNTTSLAWANADGDSYPDLAVGGYNTPTRLYHNNGDGTFTLAWESAETSSTSSLAWADVDDDGDPDLAVGNSGSVNRLYRNDGGALTLAWTSAESDSTTSLAWADWDGDGDLDLAAGNEYAPNRIYRNDGGALSLAWSAPIAEDRTASVAWADWDGDGDLDLAAGNGNWTYRANRIYRNEGGVLALEWTSAEADDTRAVAWGDVDGDGDLDLAVANYGTCWFGGDPNRLYRNDGDGYTLAWSSPESDRSTSLAWGDWDDDGDLDLAVGNNGANRVYQNDDGALTLAWSSDEWENTTAVAWGDADGDGDLDLAVANWGTNRIYENDGGTLTSSSTLPETESSQDVAWGDVDGDSDLDLAVVHADSPTRIYQNDGAGNLTSQQVFGETGWGTAAAWGDIDGDGLLDLAVSAELTSTRLYHNNGVSLTLAWSSAETNNSTALAWGDWDGDGDLDLALANNGQPNRVYRNDGGALSLAWSSLEADESTSLTWGDSDGDGDLDLAVGNGSGITGQANRVYRNSGQPFALAGSTAQRADSRAVAWGDWDGDDDLDLALANAFAPAHLYRNDGGLLTLSQSLTETTGIQSLAWGDVDADGDLDLAVGDSSGSSTVYENDGSSLVPLWTVPDSLPTAGLAWGDFDGDGDLDLALANDWQPNQVYRNDGDSLALAWSGAHNGNSRSVAWGDVDGDGDLDLAIGNGGWFGAANQVYRNSGGDFALAWESAEMDETNCVAWADFDGDGLLDLAAGNNGYSRIYRNNGSAPGELLTAVWTSPASNNTTGVAWGDFDGDGDLDLALADGSRAQVYRNDALGDGARAWTPVWASTEGEGGAVAWGDWDGDGDLDLAVAGASNHPSRVYANLTHSPQSLPDNLPLVTLADPGQSQAADFYASAQVFERAVPISYTLHDAEGDAVRAVRGFYSLDGGDHWQPAVVTTDTLTTNLATLPPGIAGVTNTHVLTWDLAAQNFFGQSDQVVFRIQAYPDLRPTPGGAAGPYQRPFGAGAQTFPFRARGSQVQVFQAVLSGTTTITTPVAGAAVFRLPAGQSGAAEPIVDNSGHTLTTNAGGYLPGRGPLNPGDRLTALLPITTTGSYTLYHTSSPATPTGLDHFVVEQPGVQALVVSADQPLLLFNLDLTLEWDARNDGAFLDDLALALQQTSAVLYDVSDGQVALGQVRVHQARSHWLASDIVVYAQSGIRPRASMGGVAGELTDDVVSATLVITNAYGPGQIRMGPNWDPFGENLAELGLDWQRALAHELAHYLLYLPDNYLGVDVNQFPLTIDCQGSFMTNTYDDAYSEFLTRAGWVGDCLQTIAEQTTGRTDWETVRHFYDMLHAPAATNSGPALLPLAVTHMEQVDPPAAAATLPPRFFDLRDAASRALLYLPRAQAYLFVVNDPADATDDQVIALGSALGDGDRIKVRGAHAGDRLCVLAPYDETTQAAYSGCIESLSALDRSILLAPAAQWQPDIVVQAVTSRTLAVTVTLPMSASALHIQVLPAYGPVTPTLPVSAPVAAMLPLDPLDPLTFTRQITLADPAFESLVRVWVPSSTPPREALVPVYVAPPWGPISRGSGSGSDTRAWGANRRQVGAPVASGDGQVTLLNLEDILADTGVVSLQALQTLPGLPAWLAPVGQGYRMVGAGDMPRAIMFEYLQREAPVGYEHTLHVYYSPDEGQTWQRLETTLNTTYNQALAAMPQNDADGQGIYALLATVEMPALQPGWNQLGYPLPDARPVAEAFESIDGAYTLLYFYDSAAARWRLYDVAVTEEHPTYASWLNDLTELTLGNSYWLYATQTVTPYLALPGEETWLRTSAAPNPLPATFYGPVAVTASFTPTAGMDVLATVDGVVCGQGSVDELDGSPVYQVQLRADTGDGCGSAGRTVTLVVGGRRMVETYTLGSGDSWNMQAWYHPLQTPLFEVYVPVVVREG